VNGGGEVFSNFNLHMFYWGKHKIFEERKNWGRVLGRQEKILQTKKKNLTQNLSFALRHIKLILICFVSNLEPWS
jgi:hypothetical protein